MLNNSTVLVITGHRLTDSAPLIVLFTASSHIKILRHMKLYISIRRRFYIDKKHCSFPFLQAALGSKWRSSLSCCCSNLNKVLSDFWSWSTSSLSCPLAWTLITLLIGKIAQVMMPSPLHCALALTSLKERDSNLRMLFLDFSSAFTTIIPMHGGIEKRPLLFSLLSYDSITEQLKQLY